MAYAPNIARIEDDGSETHMTLSTKACEWKRDGDGGLYVKCGDFRVKAPRQSDIDGDGTAHNFAYCPYCGGRLPRVTLNPIVRPEMENENAQGNSTH